MTFLDAVAYPFPVSGSGIAVFTVGLILTVCITAGAGTLLFFHFRKEEKKTEKKETQASADL